jgi:hypothetical protein
MQFHERYIFIQWVDLLICMFKKLQSIKERKGGDAYDLAIIK